MEAPPKVQCPECGSEAVTSMGSTSTAQYYRCLDCRCMWQVSAEAPEADPPVE